MSDIERRFTLSPVQVRAKGKRRSIGGYAAVFNRTSQNLGGFVEVVAPAFFNKSRGDGWPDVLARYNHDDNMLLGTTGGGTLRLDIDETGLVYEVDPPVARADIAELVERGDVRKSSFAFRMFEDDWSVTDQGFPQRTLVSGQLVDVAPVNMPAYTDTSVGMRGIEIALRSLAAKVEAEFEVVQEAAVAGELRKFLTRSDAAEGPKKPLYGTALAMQIDSMRNPAVA